MTAGSEVDAQRLADGWTLADVAEFERLFHDLVALLGRAEQAIPPQARHALQRAVVAAADAALDRGKGTGPRPDIACLDPWREALARQSRPEPRPAPFVRPVPPAGLYDSAGEWTFL